MAEVIPRAFLSINHMPTTANEIKNIINSFTSKVVMIKYKKYSQLAQITLVPFYVISHQLQQEFSQNNLNVQK
jgi:hypothetical protein